jgi:hypothetical protein
MQIKTEKNEKDFEMFISLITQTLNLQKVYNNKKQGLRIQFEILNDREEIEKIIIDTKDFFDQIPGSVLDGFIGGVFITAQSKKLTIEKEFS